MTHGNRKGSVLIVVLFVMTVLSLVAVSFAYCTNLQSRTFRQDVIMVRLRSHAMSAVAIAMAGLVENTNDFDHRAEPWCMHEPLSSEDWLGGWTVDETGREPLFVTDYQVIDEEGKLNVSFASSEALEKLGMSTEQAASLFDWMDSDDIARAEGAENDYYMSLASPYRCKDEPVQLLDELMLIRGFGLRDYLGEDANHNRVLDPAEDDGQASLPLDNADGLLSLGWVDLLTCHGDGRVNLNTAPRAVLETLPISEESVGQIVAYREFDRDSTGDLEDHAFRSEKDIDQLQGLSEADKAVLKAVAAFKSGHFTILVQSRHLPTSLRYNLEVLVRLEGDKPEILQWRSR